MRRPIIFESDRLLYASNFCSEVGFCKDQEIEDALSKCDDRNPPSLTKYYLLQYEKNKKKKFLLAFDYLIEGLLFGTIKTKDITDEKLINMIVGEVLKTIPKDTLKWDIFINDAFWKSKRDHRKAVFFLLRMISVDLDDSINIANRDLRLNNIFEELLPDFGKQLKVESKMQTFEKMKHWKDFNKTLYEKWDAIELSNIEDYGKNITSFNRVFSNLKGNYRDFLNFEGFDNFPANLFEYLEEGRNSIDSGNIKNAKLSAQRITNLLKNALIKDGFYIRKFVFPLIFNSLRYIEDKLNKSNIPATLSIRKAERKYPFFDKDAEINLQLYIANEGKGYATNVTLEILMDTNNFIIRNTQKSNINYHWQSISPGTILIEIPLQIIESYSTDLACLFHLSWNNFDGTSKTIEDYIHFECETKKIDWQVVSSIQYYSTKPVKKDSDFIGKENRIKPILSGIETSLSSSWLFGQRRVGKTSTVQAIKRELEKNGDFIVVDIEYGQFSHDDPKTMIDQLVRQISRKIVIGNKLSLPQPQTNGSLSPLIAFMEEINLTTSKKIFIIIDEFDEIPYPFYYVNEVSQPFWQSLRSISLSDYAGFILVGGENISKLKITWGSSLNLLLTYRADKFKQEEWIDYSNLIRNPVKDVFEYTDEAIQRIFLETGGNPFFTKLLCIVIHKQAIKSHNAFVTKLEIEKSIKESVVSELELDHFQHYIDDGLKGKEIDIEEKKYLRAKFLYVVTAVLRNNDTLNYETLKDVGKDYQISSDKIDIVLNEFIDRNIIHYEDDNLYFEIPLFATFLRSRGALELPKFFHSEYEYRQNIEQQKKLQVKMPECNDLAKKWGIYQSQLVKDYDILEWIEQFDSVENQRLAFEFLKKIKYITKADIVQSLKYAYKLAISEIAFELSSSRQRLRDDVFVSYLDGIGKSGAWIALHFKETNEILKTNIIELSSLQNIARTERNKYDKMKALVLVDDFVGSGKNLSDLITSNVDMLKFLTNKAGVTVVIFAAIGFESGRNEINKTIQSLDLKIKVSFGEVLKEEEKIFSNSSRYFHSQNERDKVRVLFTEYGKRLDEKHPIGWDDMGIGIVFENNCPNNSLPILWKSKESQNFKWKPLFPRNVI